MLENIKFPPKKTKKTGFFPVWIKQSYFESVIFLKRYFSRNRIRQETIGTAYPNCFIKPSVFISILNIAWNVIATHNSAKMPDAFNAAGRRNTLSPVSYTHLDVYKRQVPYRVFLQNFKVLVCHSVFLLFFQYEDAPVSGNPTDLWIYRKQKPLVNKGISPLFLSLIHI